MAFIHNRVHKFNQEMLRLENHQILEESYGNLAPTVKTLVLLLGIAQNLLLFINNCVSWPFTKTQDFKFIHLVNRHVTRF